MNLFTISIALGMNFDYNILTGAWIWSAHSTPRHSFWVFERDRLTLVRLSLKPDSWINWTFTVGTTFASSPSPHSVHSPPPVTARLSGISDFTSSGLTYFKGKRILRLVYDRRFFDILSGFFHVGTFYIWKKSSFEIFSFSSNRPN